MGEDHHVAQRHERQLELLCVIALCVVSGSAGSAPSAGGSLGQGFFGFGLSGNLCPGLRFGGSLTTWSSFLHHLVKFTGLFGIGHALGIVSVANRRRRTHKAVYNICNVRLFLLCHSLPLSVLGQLYGIEGALARGKSTDTKTGAAGLSTWRLLLSDPNPNVKGSLRVA